MWKRAGENAGTRSAVSSKGKEKDDNGDGQKSGIPLLFLHGWPGSFLEIMKGLPLLNGAGFDVVAPSLPGFGFSSYPSEKGFDIRCHAEVLNKLMMKLGYEAYVVQGGDWGSWITRALGVMYPERVKALHLNMVSHHTALPIQSTPEAQLTITPVHNRKTHLHPRQRTNLHPLRTSLPHPLPRLVPQNQPRLCADPELPAPSPRIRNARQPPGPPRLDRRQASPMVR